MSRSHEHDADLDTLPSAPCPGSHLIGSSQQRPAAPRSLEKGRQAGPAMRQGLLLLFVMLLPIAAGCLSGDDDGPPQGLSVTFPTAVGSQIITYGDVQTTADHYTVSVEGADGWEVWLVDEFGVVRSQDAWTYPGDFETPGVIAVGDVPGYTITVTAGGHNLTSEVAVTPSTVDGLGLVDGQRAFDIMDDLTTGWNGRYCGRDDTTGGGAAYTDAANHWAGELLAMGFDEVEVQQHPDDPDLENIVAYKWGRLYPDEWIVVGGHFDVAYGGTPPSGGTWEGANDDTSGSTVSIAMAQGLVQSEWDHTVVAALWSCEELGLLGSLKFVETLPEDVTVKAYWNADMVALNWPILAPSNADPYEWGIELNADLDDDNLTRMHDMLDRLWDSILRYPTDEPRAPIIVSEGSSCSSDHCAFARRGVPTFNHHSSGGTINFWLEWHSMSDTMDAMILKAGGADELAGGYDAMLWVTWSLMVMVDNDRVLGVPLESPGE